MDMLIRTPRQWRKRIERRGSQWLFRIVFPLRAFSSSAVKCPNFGRFDLDSPLRPNMLLLLALIICLLAVPTLKPQQAPQQNPTKQEEKQEKKAKKPPINSHVILITINGLRSDFVVSGESQRLNIPTIQSLRSKGSYAVG